MNNSRFMIMILAILMVLTVACASYQIPAQTKAQAPVQPQSPTPVQNAPQSAASSSSSGNTVNVAIKGFKFVPADANVKVGDTVVWTNEDSAPHTVQSSDSVLKSATLSNGDTYKHTFTESGKHDYICGIHPSMHGSITVQ